MIRTQARYLEDPYRTEFSANILTSALQPNGNYAITLDQTYFYPTGGGQDHDTGTIGSNEVIDVIREEGSGMVLHIVKDNMDISNTSCKIEWEHRLRNMQHHSAQHLLTQCVLRLFGFSTVSANINGYTPSTLDVVANRLLTDSELEQVEFHANHVIFENRVIKTYFVEPNEIKNVPLRRPPKVSEDIRVVEIDGFDYSACGGTHCTQTGTIGLVKILKNERVNNKTRIYFIAGLQTLHVFQGYHQIISSLSASLSTNTQNLVNSVTRLSDSVKQSQKEIQALKHESLVNEAQSIIAQSIAIGNIRIAHRSYQDRPANELRTIADNLKSQDDLVAILSSYDGKRLSLVVTSGKESGKNAAEIIQKLLMNFAGKGGGDRQIAQGGGTVSADIYNIILKDGIQSIQKMLE